MRNALVFGWLSLAVLTVTAGAQQATLVPQVRTKPTADNKITVIELAAHFVTAIRVPEPVNSVVVGDPALFQVEHSEHEPELVFVKALTNEHAESNLLISTLRGRQISFPLISGSEGPNSAKVDFLLRYQPSGGFLVEPDAVPFALVAQTASVSKAQAAAVSSVANPSGTGTSLLPASLTTANSAVQAAPTQPKPDSLDSLLERQKQAPMPVLYGERPEGDEVKGDRLRAGIRSEDTTMKRTIAIVTLAVVALITAGPAIAQQRPQSPVALRGQRQAQPQGQRQAPPARPMYQRRDTWYEFLLKQFNPSNFDYGAWIEERRQVFLDASVRNPYFKYSSGVTLALMLMAVICAKQWIDHRRAMWITAEMMADLYNHDLYSREVAEKAIQKYNQHIERCNRAIEAAQHGSTLPVATADADQLNAQLQKTAGQLNVANTDNAALQEQLTQKSNVIVELSLRVDALLKKNGGNLASLQPIDLSGADPNLIKHINDLQEQLVVERKKNRQLKGA